MPLYGQSQQSMQVTTGNFRTTMDAYQASTVVQPYQPNGAKAIVGGAIYDDTPSVTYPNGILSKYRYVRYNSTANAAVVAFPAPVFWTDEAKTTVTSTLTESISATVQDIAGWLMPNSTDISGLTAALLNGNWVWICVAGYVKGGAAAAGSAGDWLVGSSGAWVPVVVASGTNTGLRKAAYLMANAAASIADIFVTVESL